MMYTRRDGMKCLRVLSKSNQATDKREEMEEVRGTFSLDRVVEHHRTVWGGGGRNGGEEEGKGGCVWPLVRW